MFFSLVMTGNKEPFLPDVFREVQALATGFQELVVTGERIEDGFQAIQIIQAVEMESGELLRRIKIVWFPKHPVQMKSKRVIHLMRK